MRPWLLALSLLIAGLAVPASVSAADTPLGFSDKARQAQFEILLAELRCLVCQNQSLADSHADLAQDLREEVYRMLEEGQSREEILEFMVARYGDFVLYRPPVKSTTWLLWASPLLLLIVVAVAWRRLQARAAADSDAALSAEDEKNLANLLGREAPHADDRR